MDVFAQHLVEVVFHSLITRVKVFTTDDSLKRPHSSLRVQMFGPPN